jgi:hypothetical protein
MTGIGRFSWLLTKRDHIRQVEFNPVDPAVVETHIAAFVSALFPQMLVARGYSAFGMGDEWARHAGRACGILTQLKEPTPALGRRPGAHEVRESCDNGTTDDSIV